VVVVPPGADAGEENDENEAITRSDLASRDQRTLTDDANVRDFAGGIVRFGLREGLNGR
jgi:hypothetical protein